MQESVTITYLILLKLHVVTNNALAEETPGQYTHINVHFEIDKANLQLLKFIQQGCERGTTHGDS